MDPLNPNTSLLPPALRALAMGLVVDKVVPAPDRSRQEGQAPSGHDGKGADRAALWCDLRWKCGEISALALQADDPESAAAYVLDYLPKLFEYAFGFGAGKASLECTYAAP